MNGPRRERMAPWKIVWCIFAGHDWGMYWSVEEHGYQDICVRCGRHK